MSDLKQLLGEAVPGDVGSPDLELIERRVGRRRVVRTSVWAAAAVVLAVGVVAGALQLTSTGSVPQIVGQPDGVYDPAWAVVPDAPLDGRAGAASVWTGERVIVWGGGFAALMGTHPEQEPAGYIGNHPQPGEDTPLGQVTFPDGATLDPEAGAWEPIADAPFTSGHQPRAVWTGHEMIVATSHVDTSEVNVAAYRPETDRWRVIDHPIGTGVAVEIVWTGDEMLVWGAFDHRASRGDVGWVYDPDTDRWSEVPDAPVPARQWHTAVWTGEEMVMWGGSDLTGTADEDLGGAAYDPDGRSWRKIADAPISFRYRHTAVWTGTEMIVWGGQTLDALGDGAAYDPASDTWRKIADAPIEGRLYHVAVWDGHAMVVWAGSRVFRDQTFTDGASYLPEANRWTSLPDGPLEARCDATSVSTGDGAVIWGGLIGCEPDDHSGAQPAADGAVLRPSNPRTAR